MGKIVFKRIELTLNLSKFDNFSVFNISCDEKNETWQGFDRFQTSIRLLLAFSLNAYHVGDRPFMQVSID